jgi:DNA sulfur modification protein DndB
MRARDPSTRPYKLTQPVPDTSMTSITSKTRGGSGVETKRRRSTGGRARSNERRFAAIRAVQAGRAYFVTACPLRLVPEILSFDGPDLPPQLRAQRVLNKARVPQIARYLTANPGSYVLSAITASIDADARFEPRTPSGNGIRAGDLVVPAKARILVNDGQHRRAAITEALKSRPELANESVPLVLFLDAGLTRSQQIFADLNRHVIRPSTSLNVLYDHRDQIARLARRVAAEVCPFSGLTELERSSLSNRSSKMFTLSAIHQATRAFLDQKTGEGIAGDDERLVIEFWTAIGKLIQKWGFPTDARTAADLRRDYIHAHGVALHALGAVGGELVAEDPDGWKERLMALQSVDWTRANQLWEGRAIHNGRISKSSPSLTLTGNVLRQRLGLEISDTNRAFEDGLPEERRVYA